MNGGSPCGGASGSNGQFMWGGLVALVGNFMKTVRVVDFLSEIN
jgi:hypothetical protein